MRPISNVNPEACSICFADYEEEGPNKPKLLPCSHTYCLECLASLISSNKVECPICRKKHHVPSGGADKFPTNRDIVQVNRLVARLQSVRNQGGHGESPPEGNPSESPSQNPPPENPYLEPSAFDDTGSAPSPTAPGLDPSAPSVIGADGSRPDSVVYDSGGGELVLIPETLLRHLSNREASANRDTIVVGRSRDATDRESPDTSDEYSSSSEPEYEEDNDSHRSSYYSEPPEVNSMRPEVNSTRPEVMTSSGQETEMRSSFVRSFYAFSYQSETKDYDIPPRRRQRRGWCYGPWCKAWACGFGIVFVLAVGGGLVYYFLF